MWGPKLSFNRWALTRKIFNLNGDKLMELKFNLKTFDSDNMLIHQLSQNLNW